MVEQYTLVGMVPYLCLKNKGIVRGKCNHPLERKWTCTPDSDFSMYRQKVVPISLFFKVEALHHPYFVIPYYCISPTTKILLHASRCHKSIMLVGVYVKKHRHTTQT